MPYTTLYILTHLRGVYGVFKSDGDLKMWGGDWVEAGDAEGKRIHLKQNKVIEVY